ncbi:MAG: membrane dipeptidase [Patescibacteria group bacterium]|nr:membrane dipeptidase [Patescibacteria group bacterium]
MSELKLSSLHDDVRLPFQRQQECEYSQYPDLYPDIGRNGEHSVLQRMLQFGVEQEDCEAAYETGAGMSEKAYETLVGWAVKDQYGFVVASIYDEWNKLDRTAMEKVAEETAWMVARWTLDGVRLVQRGKDIADSAATSVVVSIEGLHLLDGVKTLNEYDIDSMVGSLVMNCVRIFGIQYGYHTPLAEDGLTPYGYYAVDQIIRNGLIVDLAHSLPQTRVDILDYAEDYAKGSQIAYTHGAPSEAIAKDPAFADKAEKRGLRDIEIKRLMSLGGIVGLGVSRPFFQNQDQLAETIDRLAQFPHGIDSLAIGADFGGVPPSFLIGMKNPKEVCSRLGDLLAGRFHFSDEHIRKVLAENAKTWIRTNLAFSKDYRMKKGHIPKRHL